MDPLRIIKIEGCMEFFPVFNKCRAVWMIPEEAIYEMSGTGGGGHFEPFSVNLFYTQYLLLRPNDEHNHKTVAPCVSHAGCHLWGSCSLAGACSCWMQQWPVQSMSLR